ncbi:carboxylate-amine ligase [Kiloniella laminariae]|uniref:carboxylate-amine ligase n=1 Tax=Kiloniella laminariae TaxID=454162 RepID=UPI0003640BD3|nr:carboxylate-amine ligase [Kiloniella laminariae]
MIKNDPSFSIGIEEEYWLVDKSSRDLVREPPKGLMEKCKDRLGSRVSPEFMQCQIEIGTSKCDTISTAGKELAELRSTLAEICAGYGLAIISASTHPFATWSTQKHTPRQRYDAFAEKMQGVVRRLLICGMHVHVGLDDDELRNDLMGQVSYFLPHMLALTTSSPFWHGKNTGLKSYRLSVFKELPRSGLPERFDSYGEYQRNLDIMVNAGIIQDASMVWWDVRPSVRFPTLEMRIADSCTNLKDTLCVAAFYASLLRLLYSLKRKNQRWRIYSNLLIEENRWRAQRYGTDEGLIDLGRGEVVPYGELLEELLGMLEEHAVALGCRDELFHARTILSRGSSAHQQVAVYDKALAAGDANEEALCRVVDFLIEETLAGL